MVARPDEEQDLVRLTLNAGTAFAYGNARNVSVNLGAKLELRLDIHAIIAEGGWLFGVAATRLGDAGVPGMTENEFGDPKRTGSTRSSPTRRSSRP